eukprot:CAMPEP_0174272814 /NCGR_PEP_ID=MMETSP0439-20130205/52525_1 /TAXON_ID=0 /ORGANISM="Stereomyxa ramosa, Strain Chinc5" /LENGTH=66 /DNA_ID=CAMNT_0015363607 /DNA_START=712 /DNA_END=912 /DNA_ORIENTATION=+
MSQRKKGISALGNKLEVRRRTPGGWSSKRVVHKNGNTKEGMVREPKDDPNPKVVNEIMAPGDLFVR